MTQTPFDSFSKELLTNLLASFGQVETSYEVAGESRWVDVYFSPTAEHQPRSSLGLLAHLTGQVCLIEPFRNPVTQPEVRACLLKLLAVQAKQLKDPVLAGLWILTPTASARLLAEFGVEASKKQPLGVYEMAPGLKAGFVVIHQLPETPETLWLRLLGRDRVQTRAIKELLALPETTLQREEALRSLVTWKIMIDRNNWSENAEVLMSLSQVYLEWEQKTAEQGRQLGREEGHKEGRKEGEKSLILKLLTRRIGTLSTPVQNQIEALSLEQLENLAESLLDFSSPEDLTHWLHTFTPSN